MRKKIIIEIHSWIEIPVSINSVHTWNDVVLLLIEAFLIKHVIVLLRISALENVNLACKHHIISICISD